MKKMATLIICILVLAGCSSVNSLGVQQIGKDSYTVTSNMKGMMWNNEENSALTRSTAISDANRFCKESGLSYANVTKELVNRGTTATAIVYFSCE